MSIAIPEHWKIVDVFVMREDRIRILHLSLGWDYFLFSLGCYWFVLNVGWRAPLYAEATLGAYVRLAWNTRRRKLQWGSLAWYHSKYWYVVQDQMYPL